MWHEGDDAYKLRLSQAIELLGQPDMFVPDLEAWLDGLAVTLQAIFETVTSQSTFPILYKFVLELLDAGLALSLLKLPQVVKERTAVICDQAFGIIHFFIGSIEDTEQLREVCSKIIHAQGLQALLETIQNGTPWTKFVSIRCLKRILSCVSISDTLTSSQISAVLRTCYTCFRNAYPHVLDEWREPSSLLRQDLKKKFGDANNASPDALKTQLQQWLSEKQEMALDACLAIFHIRTKPINRKLALEIVQENPAILTDLLELMCEPRPPWHPTRATDSLASRMILQLMALPPEVIPGFDQPLGCFDDADRAEWNAALTCIKILHSLPTALASIIRMRTKVIEEDVVALDREVLHQNKPGFETPTEVFTGRGDLVVTSLRLLINMTYLDLTPGYLLALLPLAYRACERYPISEKPWLPVTTKQFITFTKEMEGRHHIMEFHKPSEHHPTVASSIFVASGAILGPMLLFRVLVKLSNVGYQLQALQQLKTLPRGIPIIEGLETHLAHIHQIVSPKIMGKLIRMTVERRIPRQREFSKTQLFISDEPYINPGRAGSAAAYISAAELAISHAAYGLELNKSGDTRILRENRTYFTLAKKEGVLCIGNAAEAAGRLGLWPLAKRFARVAVEICDTVLAKDAKDIEWDIESSRGKNERRLKFAVAQLG
ncbi:hypothetical protein FRC02_010562 [Tulasnella sp. 418]|nr:hypothetical protein FRC02_010562 [Tulasnella sp. 418]